MTPDWKLKEMREIKARWVLGTHSALGHFPRSASGQGTAAEKKCYNALVNARTRFNAGVMDENELSIYKDGSEELYDYVTGPSDMWLRHLNQLIRFIEKNNRFPSSIAGGLEGRLYAWIHNTRGAYKKGNLIQERLDKINGITPLLLTSKEGELAANLNRWILEGKSFGSNLSGACYNNDTNSLLDKGISNKNLNILLCCGITDVNRLIDKIRELYNTSLRENYKAIVIATKQLNLNQEIKISKDAKIILSKDLTLAIFNRLDTSLRDYHMVRIIQRVYERSSVELMTIDIEGMSDKINDIIENELSDKLRLAIETYYIQSNNLDNSAEILGLSREGVRQQILSSISYIRKAVGHH